MGISAISAIHLKLVLVSVLLALGAAESTKAADEAATESHAAADERCPLIVIEDVPLRDALRNLARQMKLNLVLDPAVPGEPCGRGATEPEPTVSKAWHDVTVNEVMRSLLKEHQLILVTNPVTTVARIAPGSVAVRPVPEGALGQGASTNQVVPLVVIDDVLLLDALRNAGRQAGLTVSFSGAVLRAFDRSCSVRVRWEELSARQAFVALLDNHGLTFSERPNGAVLVGFKAGR